MSSSDPSGNDRHSGQWWQRQDLFAGGNDDDCRVGSDKFDGGVVWQRIIFAGLGGTDQIEGGAWGQFWLRRRRGRYCQWQIDGADKITPATGDDVAHGGDGLNRMYGQGR